MVANNDHPIRVEPNPNRLRVSWKGRTLASTSHAVTLFEASYPGVRYIPRTDADMTLLRRSAHTTRCPFKGQANYFSIVTDDGVAENAVWTYENPFPVAEQIAGYLAFDPRHASVIEE
jgi:uncharacterized protein (DUF427 family)